MKVRIEGVGPLSYVGIDDANSHHTLEEGDSITVDFKEKLQIFGSSSTLLRCNVVIKEAET